MTQPNATFGVAITADDRTGKGAKSAEKRLGGIPKHVSAVNKRYADEADRSLRRGSVGILRTFGQVEQASAKVFGGRALTTGLTTRLAAIREAGAAAGTGLGEAATAGGVLEGAMTAVGVVAAGTIGVLAAAGYAAFKLADGWAQGAASIGRTAATIGVATRQLQEFNAAAERQGVDKGTATSAVAGLSQSLNDARYGRNNDAVALLSRMGVKLQLNQDGTVNTGAMLPVLADAIARQNSSGRRTSARILGIPESALPAFAQGGASLGADMKDADATAYIASDADIARGQRIARKGAIIGQMKDRAIAVAGSATADAAEPGYDAAISAGRGIISGTTSFGGVVKNAFAPAASKIGRAAEAFAGGVSRFVTGLSSGIIGAAQAAERKRGVPASITLGQYGLESGWGRHMPAGSNNPFGIKARHGEPFVLARTREEDASGRSYYTMAKFRKFASLAEAFDEHARLLQGKRYATARASTSVDEYADALTGVYATDHNYGRSLRSLIHKDGLTDFDHGGTRRSPEPIPVKVEIDMRGAPRGTRTKVTAGNRSHPAVSHAMAH